MERKRLGEAVDGALYAAGRLHLLLLRFLTGTLTLFLILVPVTGVWMVSLMRKYSVFRDFFGYLRRGQAIGSLAAFLLCYMGMFGALFWLCIVCRRLRIAKRLIVWSMIWVPFLNYGLALYVRGLARQEIDHSIHKIRLYYVRLVSLVF